jgi:hypothetical protein
MRSHRHVISAYPTAERKVEFLARASGQVESPLYLDSQVVVGDRKSHIERFDFRRVLEGMFWSVGFHFGVHGRHLSGCWFFAFCLDLPGIRCCLTTGMGHR